MIRFIRICPTLASSTGSVISLSKTALRSERGLNHRSIINQRGIALLRDWTLFRHAASGRPGYALTNLKKLIGFVGGWESNVVSEDELLLTIVNDQSILRSLVSSHINTGSHNRLDDPEF